MEDRFRFRVWNKENKEMIYNAEIAYDGMNYNTSWQIGKNTNDGWVDCFGYYLDYPEDYEVMQCTGLKDCTGKLIYEGDVLDVMGFVLHKVVWNQEYCRFDLKALSGKTELDDWLEDTTGENCNHRIEIKGNIYENPELMEDNNDNIS